VTPPFSIEECEDHYRIADSNDDRVATSWVGEDARELVRRLNTGAALEAAVREVMSDCEACRETTDVPGPCVRCAKFAQILNPDGEDRR
jgi:hypothetical protein